MPRPASEGLATFRFRARPTRAETDAVKAFGAPLARAFRAAYGLGIRLEIVWTTGSSAGVQIRVPRPEGARWIRSCLAAAYDLGQWLPDPSLQISPGPGPVWYARAVAGVSSPFPFGVGAAPWCESVLTLLGTLPSGTRLRWFLRPDPRPFRPEPIGAAQFAAGAEERTPVTHLERRLRDEVEERRRGLHWRLSGVLERVGPTEGPVSLDVVAALVAAASHREGGNGLRFSPAWLDRKYCVPFIVLSEGELPGLFPAPWSSAPFVEDGPASRGMSLWLGRGLRGIPRALTVDPLAGRHLLVLGETGMGKSSLLVRLAWQAIRWGTVVLLDPIGDTARAFLSGIPVRRQADTTWLSPAHSPRTINALEDLGSHCEDPTARQRALGDLVAALRRVRAGRYADSPYWGPRLEEMLALSLRAAALWPRGTFVEAERLLTASPFPYRGVPEEAQQATAELRARVESTRDEGEGARRLLAEVTRNEILRKLLCAPEPNWSPHEAVRPGSITVLSGDAPEVGEATARYLLAVHLALLWDALLGRRVRTKTFVVLDESQWYAHESVADILRLGRRFNVHLWAATQALRSLAEPVREALLTNVADFVLFRGAPEEAREFARWVPELTPDRLLRLPRGYAAVMSGKGGDVDWVRLRPLPSASEEAAAPRPSFQAPPDSVDSSGDAQVGEPARRGPTEPADPVGFDRASMRVREQLEEVPGTGNPIVHLDALRASLDRRPEVAERGVRELGRLLDREGALLRSGRDRRGRFWELDPRRLDGLLSGTPPPPASEHPREPGRPRPVPHEIVEERQPF